MSNDLALRPSPSFLVPRSFDEAAYLAKSAAESGLFGVKSPAQALVVIATGMELGLSPMQSLRGIYVINGKAVLSADLLIALCLRHPLCLYFSLVDSSPTSATWATERKGAPAPTSLTWTLDDAKRAGLTGKPGPWSQHPAAMLRARCAAALARAVYPDSLLGVYESSEGAEIQAESEDAIEARAVVLPPTKPTLADQIEGLENAIEGATQPGDFEQIRSIFRGLNLPKDSPDYRRIVARVNERKAALAGGEREGKAAPADSPEALAEDPSPAREHSPNAHDMPAPEWPRGEPWKSGGREGGEALSAQRVKDRLDDGSDRLHQRGHAVAESSPAQRERVAQAESHAALVARIEQAVTLAEQDATRTALDDGIRSGSIDAQAHASLVALFGVKFPQWTPRGEREKTDRKSLTRPTATSNKVARSEARPEDFGPPSLPPKAPTPALRIERSTAEMSNAGKAALASAKFTGPGGVKLPNPYAEKTPAAPKPRIAPPLILSASQRQLVEDILVASKPSELFAATERIAQMPAECLAYFEQLADEAQGRITAGHRQAEADGQQDLDMPAF